MNVHTQINEHTVDSIKVTEHPHIDLLTLIVVERADGGHTTESSLSMSAGRWQQVADALASLAVVATSAEPVPF